MRISDWSSDVCSSDLLFVEIAHETIEALAHGVWKRGILHHRVELCAGCVDIARQRVRPGKLGARQRIVWLDGKNALKRDDCLCRLAAVCRRETVNIVEIRLASPLCHSRTEDLRRGKECGSPSRFRGLKDN